jgi:ferrochelatase
VVLLNMGGPRSLDEVEPCRFNRFSDRDRIPLPAGWLWQRLFARLLSRSRSKVVRGYYERIGGKSPLVELTAEQARLLEARLNARQPGRFRCHVAMRYTAPFTDDVVRAIGDDGATQVVALSLYPHYTTATTGSSLWELRRALAGKPPAGGAVDLVEIDRWPDEPKYLDALATQVARGLERFPEAVRGEVEIVFSAHGLPQTFIDKGDPYVDHLKITIDGVMKRLGGARSWQLAYQSKVGRAKWLEPNTEEMLERLAKQNKRQVLAVPISFVSDHIETLYEIDLLFGEHAKKLGITLERSPSLNLEPVFIEALAELVERKLAG